MSDGMKPDPGSVCLGWWNVLINKQIGRSRADRARLKRAWCVTDALSVAAVHDLNKALIANDLGLRNQAEKLALLAMTLAQVKENTRERFAARMGQGKPKALSEIRFTALIQTRDAQALTAPLRRALAATGQGVDVAALARDLYWWGDRVRARWCFEYYGAPNAAPETDRKFEEAEA